MIELPKREVEPEEPHSILARLERSALATDVEKVAAKGEMMEEEKERARAEAAEAQAQGEEEIIEECKEVDVIGILKSIKTYPDAYAIFETEAARDAAVESTGESGGVEFHGNTLKFNALRVEPQTVQWKNCASTDLVVKAKRIAMGMCIMFAGLALWVVAFYLPYAWFTLTFNYSYGQEPGLVAGMTFSMVVVAGNALMYLVCSEVADRTRFISIDDREVCYMLLYCFACVFNVALGLITTYMVAYRVNVGLRMKTYDGTLLSNLQAFSDRFESYAMQRTLANNLYAYAFPHVPDPLLDRAGRDVQAKNLLGGLVFDLSRYADRMLDAMIAVLIFFFPGGFNIKMFLGMALSHLYIYAFYHYRVLRSIQSCNYTDKMVDGCSQWLMAIPCGCMLACFVIKANCQPGYFCLEGDEMVTACAAAFFAHIVLPKECVGKPAVAGTKLEGSFLLSDKGTCISTNPYYWYALFGVLGMVGVFIVAWMVDTCTRPIVNADGLKSALDYRSRSKVRMPKTGGADEGLELWPLDTNLMKENVAGVGVTFHFNFQLFLIVWSLAIAVGWLVLSLSAAQGRHGAWQDLHFLCVSGLRLDPRSGYGGNFDLVHLLVLSGLRNACL